jgi:outer membrane protein assembly factor BamB
LPHVDKNMTWKVKRPEASVLTVVLCAASLVWVSQLPAGKVQPKATWPQFHGPNRANVSPDKGLLKQWPEGGPKLLWKYDKCGAGFATVSIADKMIFTSGDFGKKQMVQALTLDGKVLWKTQNGKSWRGPYPGSRTNPTYSDGAVYQMNPHGRVASFDAKTGKELWAVDLQERFGAKPGRWAMAENVIVEGKVLYCCPGAVKGRIVALDKSTGKTLWANTDIPQGSAYCSPILATHNGVRQLINLMTKSVVSVDIRTGKSLWQHEHITKHDQNVTSPIFTDGLVCVSSGHKTGTRFLKIAPDNRGVKEVWFNRDLDNCHGGLLLVKGHLYGTGCRMSPLGMVCVDAKSGKTKWTFRPLSKISLTFADGMIYGMNDRGRVWLVNANSRECKIVSQFNLPGSNHRLTLAHPVVFNGRFYLRSGSKLFVYDVRG